MQPGPEISFQADPDQLEQMLINLIRNATDALLETEAAAGLKKSSKDGSDSGSSGVTIRWDADAGHVTLAVEDEGPGLLNPANVFTPFYTTKPNGSGVGLVLCRQIAEAHAGTIEISNRPSGRGCIAKVVLPRSSSNPHA